MNSDQLRTQNREIHVSLQHKRDVRSVDGSCRADKLFDSNVQIILICTIHSSLQNERNLKRYHLINKTCKSADLDRILSPKHIFYIYHDPSTPSWTNGRCQPYDENTKCSISDHEYHLSLQLQSNFLLLVINSLTFNFISEQLLISVGRWVTFFQVGDCIRR